MIPIPLTIVFMLADRLPAHVLWMGWGGVGVGWGYNVRCNCFVTDLLRHFYLRCNCFVTVLLRHFYLRCNCFVTVLLRHFYLLRDFVTTWGWGWGGVITYVAIASSRTCYATATYVAIASSRNCYATATYVAIASSRSCYATSTYVAIASSRSCYATSIPTLQLLRHGLATPLGVITYVARLWYLGNQPW